MSEQKLVDLNKTFDCDWEPGGANNSGQNYYSVSWNKVVCVVVVNEVVAWSILRAGNCLASAFFSPRNAIGVTLFGQEVLMFYSGVKECNYWILDREKKERMKRKEGSSNSPNVFFCFAFFQWDHWGGSDFFFFFPALSFLGGKIAKLWVGWIKGSLGGERQDSSCWEKKKGRRKDGKKERKDIPTRKL